MDGDQLKQLPSSLGIVQGLWAKFYLIPTSNQQQNRPLPLSTHDTLNCQQRVADTFGRARLMRSRSNDGRIVFLPKASSTQAIWQLLCYSYIWPCSRLVQTSNFYLTTFVWKLYLTVLTPYPGEQFIYVTTFMGQLHLTLSTPRPCQQFIHNNFYVIIILCDKQVN